MIRFNEDEIAVLVDHCLIFDGEDGELYLDGVDIKNLHHLLNQLLEDKQNDAANESLKTLRLY